MHIAMAKAVEARRTLGGDIFAALEACGLRVLVRPLAGRLREVYFGDVVVLADRLSDRERRELAAHALGHHLLHAGNQWHQQGQTYSRANYQERQADIFAAFFLVPEPSLAEALSIDPAPHVLAECFEITEAFASFRLRLHAARVEALA
jgi:Zn-dependent peptidase ImmA (M78 family)